jgi:hypothetical protein
MSRESRAAVASVTARSADLVEEYTAKLDEFVTALVPPFLDNAEYAARTSGLMIALNRQLARCAAAFGEVHGVTPEAMASLVAGQFSRNFQTALGAVQGEGQVLQ